jgi:hypothetical protein
VRLLPGLLDLRAVRAARRRLFDGSQREVDDD